MATSPPAVAPGASGGGYRYWVRPQATDEAAAAAPGPPKVRGQESARGLPRPCARPPPSSLSSPLTPAPCPPSPTQPLTAEEAAALAASTAPPPAGASAWNAAGTWEDRDCTAAAKAALTARLVGLEVGGGVATITALPAIAGDGACVTIVRGVARAGFDFDVTLEWTAAGGGGVVGTARLPSCSPDDLDDLAVVDLAVTSEGGGSAPPGLAGALAAAVGAALEGLAAELAGNVSA